MQAKALATAFAAILIFSGGAATAADFGSPLPPPPEGGAPCPFYNWAPTIPYPWKSIWLGHFSGGRFQHAAYEPVVLDWQNEKLCFPSQASCSRWIAASRRAFHHPEGYWTCLPIR